MKYRSIGSGLNEVAYLGDNAGYIDGGRGSNSGSFGIVIIRKSGKE